MRAAANGSAFGDALPGETAGILSAGDSVTLTNNVLADDVSRTTPADSDTALNSGGWNWRGRL